MGALATNPRGSCCGVAGPADGRKRKGGPCSGSFIRLGSGDWCLSGLKSEATRSLRAELESHLPRLVCAFPFGASPAEFFRVRDLSGLGVVSTFGVLGHLHPQGPQHSLLVSSRVPSPSGSDWPPQLPCSFRAVFCRARHGFPDRGDSRPGAGSGQDEQVDKQAGTTHLQQGPRC